LARKAIAAYLGSAADNRGGGASGIQFVTVAPLSNPGSPPTGTLGASSTSIGVGGSVTFTYNVTDPDGSGITAWDLWATGAGGASGSCCMTGPTATMQFNSAGVYRVGAQAIDRRLDLSGRSTLVVRVGGAAGVPPIANAVLDKLSGPVPLTVNVNMSGSTDPDGSINTYFIGCGGAFVSPGGSSANCTFTTPGTYWLLLQVMDNSGLMDLVSAYVIATPADGSGGGGGGGGGDEDTTPPTVSMQSPAENQTVSGTVTVSANATDASGISKVDFYLDDSILIGTATVPTSGSTYSIQWNTTAIGDGPHTLKAVATDGANNPGTSPLRAVIVEQPPPPPPPPPPPTGPTVSISSPTGGTVARKSTVTIRATAAPGDNPVVRVDIYVNSGLVCSDTTPSNGFSCTWKVPAAPGKTYNISATAIDSAAMSGTSPTVTVTAP
jgi:hypothetical protein